MNVENFDHVGACVFDMDGVVTDTARAHFECWKQVFDDFLRHRAGHGGDCRPFTRADYLAHVDGIPRYEGVRSFLQARGIDLPDGAPDDDSEGSVHGLGNRKNRQFHAWLERHQVSVFQDARALIDALRQSGIRVGIFSASRNARHVLKSARIDDLFEAATDGADAQTLGLAPKPDPAMLLETARRLGVEPRRTIVVEDAVSGVEAGAKGGFGLVVGINRQQENTGAQRLALRSHGASLVVRDLRRLLSPDGAGWRSIDRLPSVWTRMKSLEGRLGGHRLAAFLDYDGTLTPIVEDYTNAEISEEMTAAVRRLAERIPTAIISGRDLADVRARVGLDQVFYAGSHGFDIAGPHGFRHRPETAEKFLEPLDAAEKTLRRAASAVKGAAIERKTFSISVHFRKVAEADVASLEQAVDAVTQNAELRKGLGKKIFEVQPRVEWDKGRAVEWLLENTGLGGVDSLPVYLGDDITDEDAFAALAERGVSFVIRGADRLTTADYALDDPADVGRFLDWLATTAVESVR